MPASQTSNGAADRSSIIRGDVGFVSGTWTGSVNTAMAINTGGSAVLDGAYGVNITDIYTGGVTGTGGTATIKTNANTGTAGGAAGGYIQVTPLLCTAGDIGTGTVTVPNHATGDWWAMVRV